MERPKVPESLLIDYTGRVLEEFIVSNREYDLVVSNGLPAELLSCRYGSVLRFKRLSLPTPSSMVVWPNGCTVTFGEPSSRKYKRVSSPTKGEPSLSVFTTPESSEVCMMFDGFSELTLSLSTSLRMSVRIPFFESMELTREVKITVEGDTIAFGNAVALKVLVGHVVLVGDSTSEEVTITLKADTAGRLVVTLFPPRMLREKEIPGPKRHESYLLTLLKLSERFENSLRLLYAFSLNTALGLFKEIDGRTYVSAGMRYSFPRRTYFRDSFWTVLPVLSVRPELVRAQILTLASGVHHDGCPSAVLVLSPEEKEFLKNTLQVQSTRPEVQELLSKVMRYENDWWSDHHDSCAYFVLLVAEYYSRTKDATIFEEVVDGTPVKQIFSNALELIYSLNKKNLFRKPRDTNDWADNVFRSGVVTYLAGLHVAALKRGARVVKKLGLGQPSRYLKLYEVRRRELNRVTFSREKGYFVNFVSDSVCDNLSLDVVIPMVFGVLDDEPSKRTLEHMERYLETRNNPDQPYGDWGVMCVWPLYEPSVERFGKSAFPYRYHNGACWPYLSSLYALAKWMHGMEWEYPLLRWWEYSLRKGWVNLVEYYSPPYPRGSLNQGWSAVAACVIEKISCSPASGSAIGEFR